MKQNRSLLTLILLSIITFGIYGLFFWHSYAQDMNTVCAADGKHTRGILARIIFSILTLGIYELVWMYGVGERIHNNCARQGIPNSTTGGNVLLWYILGSFIIVGPFVAMYKIIDGLNSLCIEYNRRGHGGQGNVTNIYVNNAPVDEWG